MGKKPNIKIRDLNVNLEELSKKDPAILKKLWGGITSGKLPTFRTSLSWSCGSDFKDCTGTKDYFHCPPTTGQMGCI
jgi:hypothetical protein